jgi:hypothetical protein
MKTLLISGRSPVPDAVRQVVEKGSTSVHERRADEVSAEASLEADRVVFWATSRDGELRDLAARCARAEARERREVIVYVTPDVAPDVPGLAPNEVFVWPRDEDRLKIAFMTGA